MTSDFWRRVEKLFHSALERSPNSRENFLREAFGHDTGLRRHLDLLIRNDRDSSSPLERSVLSDLAGTPAWRRSKAGRDLGPYRIVSFLGAGGKGEVYRAHDLELDRDVAVKILPPELADDPQRLVHFRREARLLASLNHPNIATIYRREVTDELDYLVLELVEGEGLDCPQPLSPALGFASQIAEALEAAHEQGSTGIQQDIGVEHSSQRVGFGTPKG